MLLVAILDRFWWFFSINLFLLKYNFVSLFKLQYTINLNHILKKKKMFSSWISTVFFNDIGLLFFLFDNYADLRIFSNLQIYQPLFYRVFVIVCVNNLLSLLLYETYILLSVIGFFSRIEQNNMIVYLFISSLN